MRELVLLAAFLAQDPDPLRDFERELDRIFAACAGFEERFTLGAAGECLRHAQSAVAAAERAGDPKAQLAIQETALDRLSKAISALETKSSELRRLQNQLERGRKRAATADPARRPAMLRYALDRAALVATAAVGEATALANLGIECSRAGDWEEAEDALAEAESRTSALRASTWEATAEAPRMAAVLLARARAALGRIPEAAADLRRGLVRLPDWLDRDHTFEEALHARPEDHARLIRTLEAKGEDADALLLLGHERYFSTERAKSRALFDRVLKLRPDDPAARAFLRKLDE